MMAKGTMLKRLRDLLDRAGAVTPLASLNAPLLPIAFAPWLAATPDDEPAPGDVELPGARGAWGRLVRWTCDDGLVITDPRFALLCDGDTAPGVAHIGERVRCLYAVVADRGALGYLEYPDGQRGFAYTSDCWFD